MAETTSRTPLPDPVGGEICLDFANTIGPRRPAPATPQHDYAPDYEGLVAWAHRCGIVTASQRRELAAHSASDRKAAGRTCRQAHLLREAIYQCFSAFAAGGLAPPTALATIQEQYIDALRNGRLSPHAGRVEWSWPHRGGLEAVMWPVARSALELAVSPRAGRVKQCPGDDGQCGWLFLDTSKNNTRRWCSMRTCGGQVKSRGQAARRRAARAESH